MSMVCNKIEVLVVPENKEGIYFDYSLENEIRAVLTEDKELFSGITTVNAMLDRIGCGFRDPYVRSSGGRENFLLSMFEAFGDEDDFFDDEEEEEDEDSSGNWDYDVFAEKVKRLKYSDIRAVVLMTNDECDGGNRAYTWMRYDLKTGAVTKGTGNGFMGENSDWRDPDTCTPTPKEYIISVAL